MCTTCGCSDGSKPRVDGTQVNEDEHGHEHSHAHSHAHSHSHGDHIHSHEHEHSHEHPHEHESGHAHSHARLHDDDQVQEHSHDHEHEHSHSHEHSHDHDHEHSHEHNHEHGHDHVHEGGGRTIIKLEQDVLAKNNMFAAQNRGFFSGRGVLALNLVSSPGSGKTSLLERTIVDLTATFKIGVIEGDQETDNDAQRIKATGCQVVQINTGSGCHLEADTIARAVTKLNPVSGSIVFIENVGNLVCPALFDLGEAAKVAILSVTEGEDKPLKYPHMFRAASVMLVNKTDLLPHLKFDIEKCIENALLVNPALKVFRVSAQDGSGLSLWYDWLKEQVKVIAAV